MANLSANEVLAIALMGITATLDPLAIGSSGYVLDPSYYIEPPSPPPPQPHVSGGGGYTGAGNIAARSGNWLKVRPFWDFYNEETVPIEAKAKGAIRFRGTTSVVIVPKTEETLALPWEQIRSEDDLLLGVIDHSNTNLLQQALNGIDEMIIKDDDFLLLLNAAVIPKNDDDEIILFL